MKKKLLLILSLIAIVAIAVVGLVACDDKASGENDPIVGTWIGTEQGEDYVRHFYAEITYLEERNYSTTSGEKITNSIFKIKVTMANQLNDDGEPAVLTEQETWHHRKIENQYILDADLSPLPHNYPDKQKYSYQVNLKDNELIVTGEEIRLETESGKFLPRKITYNFERTTLTFEQYQDQLKAA